MSQTIYLVVFIQAQGQNHERVEIRANGFFDTGGLYLVCLSRTKDIKHILIGPQDMPNHLDIRLQRLDIDVIDAQAFYRELRVSGAVTLRKQSTKHPGLYGVSWSDEENEIADEIHSFWRAMRYDISTLIDHCNDKYPNSNLQEILDVISKLEDTDENLLTKDVPCLSKSDQNQLMQYRDKDKKKRKSKGKQSTARQPKQDTKRPHKETSNSNEEKFQKPCNKTSFDPERKATSQEKKKEEHDEKELSYILYQPKETKICFDDRKKNELAKDKINNETDRLKRNTQVQLSNISTPGFQNDMVNVCYANSVIQLMYRIQPLRSLLVTYNGNNSEIKALQKWFDDITTCPTSVKSIYTHDHVAGVKPIAFVMGGQNCAHEFLVHILTKLMEDEHFQDHELFEKVKTTTRCGHEILAGVHCEHVTEPRIEINPAITIGFDSVSAPYTMSNLIDVEQTVSESLDHYTCDKCKIIGECRNTTTILNESRYLFFHLSIFRTRIVETSHNGVVEPVYEKKTDPITIENNIVVNGCRYKLLGFVNHEGGNSTNSGHYTAMIREHGKLVSYNDTIVAYTDHHQFISKPLKPSWQQPYLILYEKTNHQLCDQDEEGCSTSFTGRR